jgi:hypothetical protein
VVETSPETSRTTTVEVVGGGEMRSERERVRIRVRGGRGATAGLGMRGLGFEERGVLRGLI